MLAPLRRHFGERPAGASARAALRWSTGRAICRMCDVTLESKKGREGHVFFLATNSVCLPGCAQRKPDTHEAKRLSGRKRVGRFRAGASLPLDCEERSAAESGIPRQRRTEDNRALRGVFRGEAKERR